MPSLEAPVNLRGAGRVGNSPGVASARPAIPRPHPNVSNRAICRALAVQRSPRNESEPAASVPLQRLTVYFGSSDRRTSGDAEEASPAELPESTIRGLDATLVETLALHEIAIFAGAEDYLRDALGMLRPPARVPEAGRRGARAENRWVSFEELQKSRDSEISVRPGEPVVLVGHGLPGCIGPYSAEEIARALAKVRYLNLAGMIFVNSCFSAVSPRGGTSVVAAIAAALRPTSGPSADASRTYRTPVIGAPDVTGADPQCRTGDFLCSRIDRLAMNRLAEFFSAVTGVDVGAGSVIWATEGMRPLGLKSRRKVIGKGAEFLMDEWRALKGADPLFRCLLGEDWAAAVKVDAALSAAFSETAGRYAASGEGRLMKLDSEFEVLDQYGRQCFREATGDGGKYRYWLLEDFDRFFSQVSRARNQKALEETARKYLQGFVEADLIQESVLGKLSPRSRKVLDERMARLGDYAHVLTTREVEYLVSLLAAMDVVHGISTEPASSAFGKTRAPFVDAVGNPWWYRNVIERAASDRVPRYRLPGAGDQQS